ncbi:TPA: tail fiber assembly protein [Burkholderia vietnamiensis]|nr:tail fiber assembly protein [Burkholderia vietnamiensis]
MGQKYASFDSTGNLSGFYDSIDSPVPESKTNVVPISDQAWNELLSALGTGKTVKLGSDGAPTIQQPAPPTTAQMAADALCRRDELMAQATVKIAPLQDAVDLGSATAAETGMLTQWKQYRIALNRIEQQAAFPASIAWPQIPSDA